MFWRSCERFNMIPPDIEKTFENNTSWQQAQILAYENIREMEELDIATIGLSKK